MRDTYTKGNLTVEDIFNSFSLGIGKDGVPGYPLIDAYLTGKELKLAARSGCFRFRLYDNGTVILQWFEFYLQSESNDFK